MVFKALLKNFQDLQTEDNCTIACRLLKNFQDLQTEDNCTIACRLLKNFQDLQTEDNCTIACRRRATAKHGDHRKHCSRIFKTCRRRITAKSLADGGQLQKTGITDQRNIAFRFYRIKVRSTLGNFSTSSSNPTNMMRTPSWMDCVGILSSSSSNPTNMMMSAIVD